MSLAAAHAALKAALLDDEDLYAWALERGQPWTAVEGNVPVVRIPPSERPAIVFELGDADAGVAAIGATASRAQQAMLLAFVWHEQDPATAYAQRLALPELITRALLRQPTLGGAAAWAEVVAWEPDRGAHHPVHILGATVMVELLVKRAAP